MWHKYRMTIINFQTLFQGDWRFERQVTGLFSENAFLKGRAVFMDLPKSIQRSYEEQGAYEQQGQEVSFQNSYLYDVPSPQCCRVLFPDGRLFYELSQNVQGLQHLCGEDHYEGNFEAVSQDLWTLSWYVKGPRKDYEIVTSYIREFVL